MEFTHQPNDAASLLGTLPAPWFIAGGWAIDAFVGRETRPHGDLDVAVLRDDQQTLRLHLAGWDLHVATAPGVLTPWDGSPIPPDLHVIWCRPAPGQAWAFELLLNDHNDSDWLFRRNHNVRMALSDIGWTTRDGLPCLVPEIVLLYKAKALRETDEADLRNCLPVMTASARSWLAEAVASTHGPNHPWLKEIEA